MPDQSITLKAENISKTYRSAVPVEALKPCSLAFYKGEFTAVVGKSGSGKSTLLRILATLDVPDSGELFIEGKRVDYGKDAALSRLRRRRIGFVYQDYNLFPEYTAYENIIMPLHLDGRMEQREKILTLMEDLRIEHCENKFPHELSGGEQQRVSIARALAAEPAIILADEPTGNLDADNAALIASMIRMAAEKYGRTVVMVTHDRQMAEYADRLLRIFDGHVEELSEALPGGEG